VTGAVPRGGKDDRVGGVRRIALGLALFAACGVDEGVPEGKLAVVGDVVIGPEDLVQIRTQLGAYAQRRFASAEGMRTMLQSVVDAELLAQEAMRHGLGNDPRVRWAVLEEVALLYLSAELERRVPHEAVAADEEALRAYHDAHLDEFRATARRGARGVAFQTFEEAEAAHSELLAGTPLEALGKVVRTPALARDDVKYPGFHAALFAPHLKSGDPLPYPAYLGDVLLVAVVDVVEPDDPLPFDDPEVRERLVTAVRAPRVEQARRELLAELAQRYPVASTPDR